MLKHLETSLLKLLSLYPKIRMAKTINWQIAHAIATRPLADFRDFSRAVIGQHIQR